MKNILVPTDFSSNALKAAVYSAEIAKKNGATVFLFHVIESTTDAIRQPYPLQNRLQEEITNNRKEDLEETRWSLSGMYPGIKTETDIDEGIVIPSILEFAKRKQIDLIVMGTSGATGIKEVFLGSVAAGIISKSSIPVLAVPAEYELEQPDAILFATNRFEENNELLNRITDLAKLFSASIHVAVFEDNDTAVAADYIYHSGKIEHYVSNLRSKYPGVAFNSVLLEGKEFEEAVEEYDTKNGIDIITMITYPKSFWERFVNKSMTKKMAFHSKIPVLAIPAN